MRQSYRRTAPCVVASASTMVVIAASASASVSVRSGAWNVSRYDS